jgi:hypothetical protein
MSTTAEPAGPPAVPPAAEPPSLLKRTLLVFVRPFAAWTGLETRAAWWFPLVLVLLVQGALLGVSFRRVMMPMMMEQWNTAVENGQMSSEQVEKIGGFFEKNPAAIAIVVGQQTLIVTVVMLLVALVVWFGAGFVLGAKFKYRWGLEVVTWASLVRLPEAALTYAVGWSQESLKGIHFGLAALLPAEETPTKLHAGLAVLLDAIGPFGLWYLVVTIAGCSALSGAPRKNVAWVMSGIYLGLAALFACVTAAFGPPA